MNRHSRKRMEIEGKFILHLRMQGTDLQISDIREMTGHYRTLAKLKSAGVNTISELCSFNYGQLEGIVGMRRADFIVHLLGLYGLKSAPSQVVSTTDTITAEITR